MTPTGKLSVAGGLATAAASVSLMAVTGPDSWIPAAIVGIAVVVAAGRLLERWRAPILAVPLGQLLVGAWWLMIATAGQNAYLRIIPTRTAIGDLGDVLSSGLDAVSQFAAPTPASAGINALCIAGVIIVALLVDLWSTQLRLAPLAGVPLVAIYTVAAAVVPGGTPWFAFVVMAVGYLALLVADGRVRVMLWGRHVTSSRRSTGSETSTLIRSGERVGAAAVTFAVVVPLVLPALSDGLLGQNGFGRGGGNGATITTDNPMVDLMRDLTQGSDEVVMTFTTSASIPEYIKVATLDTFDGQRWQASERTVPESQRVSEGLPTPPGLSTAVDTQPVDYSIDVSEDFKTTWLPLAYPASEIDIDGDWRFDASTLDVVARNGDTRGVSYDVTSLRVTPTAAQLRDSVPEQSTQRFVELPPEGFPDEITALARDWTQGATNDFERASMLQEYFRDNFEYSLNREPGNSADALLDFINDQSGYCEQFAATMAIMARALDIPARVAVGFLPNDLQDSDGTWVVSGQDAHAWPELYFNRVGWVRFEPTPSVRTGSAPAWTIPQTSAGQPNIPTPSDQQPGTTPQDSAVDPLDEQAILGGTDAGARDLPWGWIITGAAALLSLAIPAVTAVVSRRTRWRRAKGDPVLEAEAAWQDLRETTRDVGLPWDPAATPRVAARRLRVDASLSSEQGDLVGHVATLAERARYAPHPPDTEGLREDSHMLRQMLLGSVSRWRRLRAKAWPAATHELFTRVSDRTADVFDWLDAAGGRIRRGLTGWMHRSRH